MSSKDFAAAKVVWTNFSVKQEVSTSLINIYGDEYDFFVRFFATEWITMSESVCGAPECSAPFEESRPIHGIVMRYRLLNFNRQI